MGVTSRAGADERPEVGPPVVLVAFDPTSYREAIGSATRALRPHLQMRVVEPGELGVEVARLDPELVLCSQPNTSPTGGRPSSPGLRATKPASVAQPKRESLGGL